MVLIRRNLPLFQIEEVGVQLGLAIPDSHATLYPTARIGIHPTSGYGTEIQNPEFSLTVFFRRFNIPLQETYLANPPSNCSSWILEQLSKDRDILVCFNHQELFGGDANWGHVCLIESVTDSEIVLVDPSPQVPKFRSVSINSLNQAIEHHGESNRCGFWVLHSIDD